VLNSGSQQHCTNRSANVVLAFRPIQTEPGKLPAVVTRQRNVEPEMLKPLFSSQEHRKFVSLRFDRFAVGGAGRLSVEVTEGQISAL
jgi:hypothetical protein